MTAFGDLAELVTVRPLEGHVTCEFRRSPFSATWGSTVALLARELRAVGAERVVLEAAFTERDLRLDGLPRADRRPYSPAVRLSFHATGVPGSPSLRYEVATFHEWQDNVRAIALGLEALRAVDRYGVTKRGEQYAGWKALAAGPASPEGNAERGRAIVEREGSVARALRATHPDTRDDGYGEREFLDVQAYRATAIA